MDFFYQSLEPAPIYSQYSPMNERVNGGWVGFPGHYFNISLLYAILHPVRDFQLPSDLRGLHIHFVGIKGTGMAALTEILCQRGARITGSDVADTFYTDQVLAACGITASLFDEANITDDLLCIIYSSAYNEDTNCELSEARRRGVPCLLYSQALGQLSAHAYSCGIAGVHGKTTTTGLTGTILQQFDLPVQVLAGSLISSFGGASNSSCSGEPAGSERQGGSEGQDGSGGQGSCTLSQGTDFFVAETCEYQRHFMDFHPQKIILTSVESDHQDFFPTYKDILSAFVDYICLLPENGQLIYCADDAGACEAAALATERRADIQLLPYGETAEGDYKVGFGAVEAGCQYFYLAGFGDHAFRLEVPGRHLVLNAAAAIALSVELLKVQESSLAKGASALAQKLASGLAAFCGGKRRSELVGRKDKLVILDDYAHHPTAIKTTLEGYRAFYPGYKLVVDFMSHTYTRTAALLEEFASSFGAADQVILHKIYGSARENASASGVDGTTLYQATRKCHSNVRYYEEIMEAADDLERELAEGDAGFPNGIVFVTMGAGDNWKLGRELWRRLGNE